MSPDRPAHPLRQIYFYLTGGCNLRCRHCWIAPEASHPSEKPPTTLDAGLFSSIVGQAIPLGLSAVKLTGGEPLLHPEIEDILRFIKLKDLRLALETNGVLCTPGLAGLVASCKDPFVAVSIDGADQNTHEWVRGVKGCFDKALAGIRTLVDAGVRPQIVMTVMKKNRDQMEGLVRMAETLKASSVKFNMVQPMARGKTMHQAGEVLHVEELVELGRWVETELSASTPVPLYYTHPAAFRPLGAMMGDGDNGCSACAILNIVGVLSDGSYALCGIGETVPELVFGHAADVPLQEVWLGSPVLNQLREGLPRRLEGACPECLMKGVCMGSCIAQNYAASRSLWSGFWYCNEAKNAGLFPESRTRKAPQ